MATPTYQQITRAEVRARLADRWEGSPYWTTTVADAAINRAIRTWAAWTQFWRSRSTLSTIANDPYVALPAPLAIPAALRWGTAGIRPLVRTSIRELSRMRRTWRSDRAGVTADAPILPRYWAPVGLNAVALWPCMPTNGTLIVDGLNWAPVLADDAEYLDLPLETLDALLDLSLWYAAWVAGPAVLAQVQPLLQRALTLATAQRLQQGLTDPLRADALTRWDRATAPQPQTPEASA